jgi:hypothetical protein
MCSCDCYDMVVEDTHDSAHACFFECSLKYSIPHQGACMDGEQIARDHCLKCDKICMVQRVYFLPSTLQPAVCLSSLLNYTIPVVFAH